MNYDKISPGTNIPHEINALIEISKDAGHIKYEFDAKSGALVVDRLREGEAPYPINYGFMPHTLSDDGDALDVLVFCHAPLQPGCVMAVRPIGVLLMDDEKGRDVKIIAVPADHLSNAYRHIKTIHDLPHGTTQKIANFFEHYKDTEKANGKWSRVTGWLDLKAAHDYILNAVAAYRKPPAGPTAPVP